MRNLELLAPAKNADIGIEAIRHGADAVYIGASEFGARAAAGNDIDEIRRLVEYAHVFRAKVYVTVNTIVYDHELKDVEDMIWELYHAKVDALIIQDFGILRLNLPPIPLHASTQMDNRSADKVRFLAECGFEQVVLARELTPRQIADIHDACPDVSLEVFVHGAMCVSYSGQCYASEAIFGRSANRGECAQLCRMEYDLVSRGSDERVLVHNKRLLSIRDNCQIDKLETLVEAGATSFKIEGRLKDVDYVKNVTADYSRVLDDIVARHPDMYVRASSGRSELKFEPDWRKSFFRSFEFQHKSVGEYIGKVKDVFTNHFTISTTKKINNGDGACFIDTNDNIVGFRINKAEDNALYPYEMPRSLRHGIAIYRNQDHKFEQLLAKPSAERRIPVTITIDDTESGFVLVMTDSDGCEAKIVVDCEKELARSPQLDNVKRQLAKLGDTPFVLDSLDVMYRKNWFIPSSLLSDWRRRLSEQLMIERKAYYSQHEQTFVPTTHAFPLEGKDGYLLNVANEKAMEFYRQHGVEVKQKAFELSHPEGTAVMICKHCIRRSLGMCLKKVGKSDDDLFIRLANGKEFRLDFDCEKCDMLLMHNSDV